MAPSDQPAIAVLLATHNGQRWLDEQLDTILAQEGVDLRLIVLDDGSTDGTPDILRARAAADPRVVLMPPMGRSGSSAANFYRLIQHAPVLEHELVGFADQDDRWLPGKLARHAALLADGFDGVSSSVTSFWPDGRRRLVKKSYPQRRYDYLFESPGPGLTFLMTPSTFGMVRSVLASGNADAHAVDFHDSLTYALARSAGLAWHIDDWPAVEYRQHDENVMGANSGFKSATSRFALIRRRWHRQQALHLARAGLTVADDEHREDLTTMVGLLERGGPRTRLALARMGDQLRRRPRDRRIIAALILLGIW